MPDRPRAAARMTRSMMVSMGIASLCMFAGLVMVFVPEEPRPLMGWTLVGLGFALELVAAIRFVVLARARERAARQDRNA